MINIRSRPNIRQLFSVIAAGILLALAVQACAKSADNSVSQAPPSNPGLPGVGTPLDANGTALPEPANDEAISEPPFNDETRDVAPLRPGPELWIPADVVAATGESVVVPIHLTLNDNSVASIAFSVDYDEEILSLDDTDANEDGIPEAVALIVPESFNVFAALDEEDTDGELDIAIFNASPTGDSLPEGILVEITFGVNQSTPLDAQVKFSNNPRASFGDPFAKDIPGTTRNGFVQIR